MERASFSPTGGNEQSEVHCDDDAVVETTVIHRCCADVELATENVLPLDDGWAGA